LEKLIYKIVRRQQLGEFYTEWSGTQTAAPIQLPNDLIPFTSTL